MPATRVNAVAAVLVAVAGILVTGCGGSDAEPAAVTVVVTAPAPAPALAPETDATPAPAEPLAAPAQPVGQAPEDAAEDAAATTAPAQLDEAAFWQLIAETRSAAGNDTGRQSELLDERLRQLSPQAIVEFAQMRRSLDERAYTWDLWGAAYVIEDGCSDDCFRDFRGYVISLGRGPYEAALRDPDSLASVAQDEEGGDWENADDVAPDAYSSVVGDDFPLDDSDLSGPPRGTPFNENDEAALTGRYPRLAARFR